MTPRNPRSKQQAAFLAQLRDKGLGLAPRMVSGRVVSREIVAVARPSLGVPADDLRLERTALPERGSKPADRLTAPGDVFEFTIVAPCKFLNANDSKGHWGNTAPLVKAWRGAGYRAGMREQLPVGISRLQVDCFVWKPVANRYDPANWAPTAKAVLDGLIDYGLAEDDNRHFVTGPFMHEGGKGADALVVRVTVLASSS